MEILEEVDLHPISWEDFTQSRFWVYREYAIWSEMTMTLTQPKYLWADHLSMIRSKYPIIPAPGRTDNV